MIDRSSKRRPQIKKLFETAWCLERGEEFQVTKLMPVQKLVGNIYECRPYFDFLLGKSREYFEEGRSLTTVRLLSDENKRDVYENALRCLGVLYSDNEGMIKVGKELIDLYQFCQELSPGHKRISIHAGRRCLEDPDLVLIEQAVRYSLNHWYRGGFAYFLSQYYCCDYRDLRFRLDAASSSRVMDIAEYFSKKYLGGGVEMAW